MKRVCWLGLLLSLSATAYPITFNFSFDNDLNPGLQPPLVGSGSFTFENDPGDGTFQFSDLGTFSMSFAFPVPGVTFTEADLVSDLNEARVVLSTGAVGRRLQFSDTGFGSGLFGGALDFLTPDGTALSFEPSFVGEGLRLFFVDALPTFYLGDYLAQEVPDKGSTAGLLAFGSLLLGAVASRHRLSGVPSVL